MRTFLCGIKKISTNEPGINTNKTGHLFSFSYSLVHHSSNSCFLKFQSNFQLKHIALYFNVILLITAIFRKGFLERPNTTAIGNTLCHMSRQDNVSTVQAEPISSASKHLSKGEAQKTVAGFHIRSHQLDLIGYIDGFILEPPITKQGFPNRSDSKVKHINSPSVPGERGLADCTANPSRTIA
jgi:hypothetical protein